MRDKLGWRTSVDQAGRGRIGASLAPLSIQVVAVIAEFVSVRAIFPLILRYLTTPRTRIVVVIDAICERLLQFMNGVEIGGCWHGNTGRARLRCLGSFGSRDEFLVALPKQEEMLITHEISPYRFIYGIHDRPRRARFDACLRLATISFSRLRRRAIARSGFIHAKNNRRSPSQC